MSVLDDQYNQAINQHRDYLAKLQTAFNAHCDQITAAAQKQLQAIPETSAEARQAVMAEQKKQMEAALSQLKAEIDLSTNKNRRVLEEIHAQREAQRLAELEQIMTQMAK
jgi:hypothetical protein